MTLSAGSTILVAPSAVSEAAGRARAIASGVSASAGALPGVSTASLAGDGACADAFVSAGHLLEEAVSACAAGLQELAGALEAAAGSYRAADVAAVPRGDGGLRRTPGASG